MRMPQPRRGVVAVICREDDHLLVIQRSQYVTAPGAYCFPGGALEPGESEPEALCRELREELGIAIRPVRRVWQCLTARHVDLAWWAADLLDPAVTPRPCPREVAAWAWMPTATIRQLPNLLDSNHHFLEAWQQGRLLGKLR
jgi:8-oxo-dGTP diphosphatase